MSNSYTIDPEIKVCSPAAFLEDNNNIIGQFGACVAGDINNDRLNFCKICSCNGWLHEAITFEKVLGRVRSDGTNDVARWIIRDYFTGRIHEHKHKNGKSLRGGNLVP